MKKRTSIILLISIIMIMFGTSLAVFGYLAFGGSTLVSLGEDGVTLPGKRIELSYSSEIPQFNAVSLESGFANVTLEEGEDYHFDFKSTPRYGKKAKTDLAFEDFASIKDGKLVIAYEDHARSAEGTYFGFDSSGPVLGGADSLFYGPDEIVITVPRGTTLKTVDANAGNSESNFVLIKMSANKLKADESRGGIIVEGGSFNDIDIKNHSGEVSLFDDVVVKEEVKIQSEDGAVNITKASLKDLNIKNGYGGIILEDVTVKGKAQLRASHGAIVTSDSRFLEGLSTESFAGIVRLHGELRGKTSVSVEDSGDVVIFTTLSEDDYSFDTSAHGPLFINNEQAKEAQSSSESYAGKSSTFIRTLKNAKNSVKAKVASEGLYIGTDSPESAPENWHYGAPNEWNSVWDTYDANEEGWDS